MIKIQRADTVLNVTPSAFESIFKPLCFVSVKDIKSVEPVIVEEVQKSEDEIYIEEITLKPISSWTKEELSRVVSIKNIDTSGANTVKQAKEIVKEALGI